MYDERTDRQLCLMNKNYKRIKYGINSERARFFSHIFRLVLSFHIIDAIKSIVLLFYEKFHCSTNNNIVNSDKCHFKDISDKRVAVFSCIVGNYDKIIEPVVVDNFDYYIFTDIDVPKDSIWKKIDITKFDEYKKYSPVDMNRMIKLLSFKYLSNYDYTVYVDGNIQIVSYLSPLIKRMKNKSLALHTHRKRDCLYDEINAMILLNKSSEKKLLMQKKEYKKSGFPQHYGLFENGVIILDNSDKQTIQIMKLWWEEYCRYGTRDQICLPYILWKNAYDNHKILVLGNNIYSNKRFNIVSYHLKDR